jgi:hypothetical protein
MSCGSI